MGVTLNKDVMKNIIGKYLVPTDNSQIECLTNSKRVEYLAGNSVGDIPRKCLILSNPYKFTYRFIGNTYTDYFVTVHYDGDVFRVMYFEDDVNASLIERINENDQRNNDLF